MSGTICLLGENYADNVKKLYASQKIRHLSADLTIKILILFN